MPDLALGLVPVVCHKVLNWVILPHVYWNQTTVIKCSLIYIHQEMVERGKTEKHAKYLRQMSIILRKIKIFDLICYLLIMYDSKKWETILILFYF